MNPTRRGLLAALPAALAPMAWSQPTPAWPSRPLKILVGFPPGSSPDQTARALADGLAQRLGQAVVVENKAGASGNIASAAVAQAGDDHTVGVLINGNLTIAKLLNPATPFDPARDFTPVGLIGTAPLVLAAAASLAGNTPAELLAAARGLGDQANYGSPGNGTVAHLGLELVKGKTGITAQHVPFAGNPQVITALLAGQVQLALLPPALAMAQVRAGKLKAIGVTSPVRSALVPELPSLREVGVQGADLEIWNAMAAPASFPQAALARLSAALAEVVRSPEGRTRLFQLGWQAVGASGEGLAHRMKADTALLGGIITARGIKVE
jgi:tripartite-type tricarboxylate transporter receptor subunit TctC